MTRRFRRLKARRACYRPQLVPLEDRIVPSTFTEVEPNNTPATANVVTVDTGDILTTQPANWLQINGGIGSTSDLDYFRFTLATRSGVFFDIDSRDIGLSATLNTTLVLYDANGTTVLDSNTDGYDFEGFAAPLTGVSSALSPDSSLYRDLNAGTYYIRVSQAGGTTGNYYLRILADSSYSSTVPVFASLPGAPDTIFLDFDGHSATDAWGTYSVPAYDFSGNGAEFTPAERLAMRNVWRVVAEDYAFLNLNVTTSYAGSFADGVGFRQVIGNSDGAPFGAAGSLGKAIVASYATGGASNNVAHTFTVNFPTYGGGISGQIMAKPLEIGNTSSHEVGHAFRLRHYEPGTSGTAGPLAIMYTPDTGLSRETWRTGTNELGQPQDDVAVISNPNNLVALRADDHGGTTATATVLTPIGSIYSASGNIHQINDLDFFRFIASGSTTITIDVDEYVNNLDTELRLYNASGALLATVDPGTSFDSTLTMTLSEGTYYIDVRSDAEPGELGQYTVRITTTLPPLVVVIDDGDAGFSATPGFFSFAGEGYQNDVTYAGPGDGSEYAVWSFTGLPSGTYRVSATWTAHINRATNTPFSVWENESLLGYALVNQELPPSHFTAGGAAWHNLGGTYTITTGNLAVYISNLADEYVIADAIRIERLTMGPVQIKDDGDAGFVASGGFFAFVGEGYQNDVTYAAAGSGNEQATWTFTALPAGVYRVSVTWTPHENRATNAPFTVLDGTTPLETFRVNQQAAPGDFVEGSTAWKDLGTGVFTISSGSLTIRLTDDANGYVIADAVRIERIT